LDQQIQNHATKVDQIKNIQDIKLSFGWIFWPSYFIIDDNRKEAVELGKLRGKLIFVEQLINDKKCLP
jgi:hypothetical protein